MRVSTFFRGRSQYRTWWTGGCGCHTATGTDGVRPNKGEKPSVYDSSYVETGWYEFWRNSGQFELPTASSSADSTNTNEMRPTFAMCLPPPNVTGNLHIGHAMTIAIEDVLVRWRRMCGDRTVWIPGYDHAGIATQVVVEKQLMREKGLRRVDMKREDFIAECLRWKQSKIDNIQMQMERLGASLDWSRAYYTMDENFSNAVTEAFVRLHRRGLIFRAERLVNWCPYLKSTVSDIEVNKTTLNCSEILLPGRPNPIPIGRLFYVKYPLADNHNSRGGGEFLTVATTRLETIPADVALAVHPDDQRYAKYIGQYVRNPVLPGAKPIGIIADSQVDPNFGTGVLKVTPAHDWTDFEIGTRHRLPLNVRCMTEGGLLNEQCGADLVNLDRFEARERIAGVLSANGLLTDVKRQPQITLPLCSRTGDIIEPMLKQQWFIDCRRMAADVTRALEEGKLTVKPQFSVAQWKHWLSLTGDWCLSRQLWWGHRIPAYKLRGTDDKWYCGRTAEDALESAKRDQQQQIELADLQQDEDVLDTWFSSSLVPLVASGWPQEQPPPSAASSNSCPSSNSLYPLSLIETGHDILIFWVTRMAMMGFELCDGRLPFEKVLLHGIVFDKNGRKMSKSLGNVVDPLDIIDGVLLDALQGRIDESSLPPGEKEIAKDAMAKEFPQGVLPCGADALRFTLLKQDVFCEKLNLDVNLMLSGRKFCNKLWQWFNFMETTWRTCASDGWKCDDRKNLQEWFQENNGNFSIMDHWILSRLSRTVGVVNQALRDYELQHATGRLYDFAWFELCDLYLEWTKCYLRPLNPNETNAALTGDRAKSRRIIGDILYLVADVYVRCLAPFMPFLAEELHDRLFDIRSQYPPSDFAAAASSALTFGSVHASEFPKAEQILFANDELEKRMTVAKNVLDASRSLRNEFGISSRDQLNCVLFGDSCSLEAARSCDAIITLLGKLAVKEYRPLDGNLLLASSSSYIWKSVDESLLLAMEVQGADHATVIQRLAAQIDKLKKRKREHELRRRKNERLLSGEIEIRRKSGGSIGGSIEQQIESLKHKISNMDLELSRLERMYANFRK